MTITDINKPCIYYTDGQTTFGPFSVLQINQMEKDATISPSTLICFTDNNNWRPISQWRSQQGKEFLAGTVAFAGTGCSLVIIIVVSLVALVFCLIILSALNS